MQFGWKRSQSSNTLEAVASHLRLPPSPNRRDLTETRDVTTTRDVTQQHVNMDKELKDEPSSKGLRSTLSLRHGSEEPKNAASRSQSDKSAK